MNLLLQVAPTGITDVLGMPFLYFFLGLGIWYGGVHFENRTEKTWLKWCAFIPIAIGLYIGFNSFMLARDFVYQQMLPNRKTLYSHYLALVLPIVAIITILLWQLYLKRSRAHDRY